MSTVSPTDAKSHFGELINAARIAPAITALDYGPSGRQVREMTDHKGLD